jgi:hypothetical protein
MLTHQVSEFRFRNIEIHIKKKKDFHNKPFGAVFWLERGTHQCVSRQDFQQGDQVMSISQVLVQVIDMLPDL